MRHGDDYDEDDMGMRWLKANDPDAQTGGYADRHGVIDKPAATRIARLEKSFGDPDIIHTAQHVHCNGCKDSQRRRVHA